MSSREITRKLRNGHFGSRSDMSPFWSHFAKMNSTRKFKMRSKWDENGCSEKPYCMRYAGREGALRGGHKKQHVFPQSWYNVVPENLAAGASGGDAHSIAPSTGGCAGQRGKTSGSDHQRCPRFSDSSGCWDQGTDRGCKEVRRALQNPWSRCQVQVHQEKIYWPVAARHQYRAPRDSVGLSCCRWLNGCHQ